MSRVMANRKLRRREQKEMEDAGFTDRNKYNEYKENQAKIKAEHDKQSALEDENRGKLSDDYTVDADVSGQAGTGDVQVDFAKMIKGEDESDKLKKALR